jgi:hypothetical protein
VHTFGGREPILGHLVIGADPGFDLGEKETNKWWQGWHAAAEDAACNFRVA